MLCRFSETLQIEMRARLFSLRDLTEGFRAHAKDLIRALAMDANFPVKVSHAELNRGLRDCETWFSAPSPERARFDSYEFRLSPEATPAVIPRILGRLLSQGVRTSDVRFRLPESLSRTSEVFNRMPSLNTDAAPLGGRRFLYAFGGSKTRDEMLLLYRRGLYDRIVFDGPVPLQPVLAGRDADPGEVAEYAVARAFANGGRYSLCSTRLYVHRTMLDDVLEAVVRSTGRIRVGDPLRQDTDVGPMLPKDRATFVETMERLPYMHRVTGRIADDLVHPYVLVNRLRFPLHRNLRVHGPALFVEPVDCESRDLLAAVGKRSVVPIVAACFGTLPPEVTETVRNRFTVVLNHPRPLDLPYDVNWSIGTAGSLHFVANHDRSGCRNIKRGSFSLYEELFL